MVTLFALGIAVIAALPWVAARRMEGAITTFVISFVLGWLLVYLVAPTTAGPLFGGVGFMAACFLCISGVFSLIQGDRENKSIIPFLTALAVAGVYVVLAIGNSPMMRARDYAALAPKVEPREWSADFQPKDPRHFRVSSQENATFLAGRAIGQATTLDVNGLPNAIGSQFQVYTSVSSPQIVKDELWTIVPLDWTGWGPQFSGTVGVPGYIKVSGENPVLPAKYVPVAKGKEFRYSPESIWENNLERLVWREYPGHIIADKHLELDDNDVPHYIISLAKPTIGWWGEIVVGALVINPVTGAGVDKLYAVGDEPSWVDRVEAEYIVHRNIDYHGKYAGGFLNRSFYGNSVLAATETHFGYGSDGQPVFATGITSHNTSDDKKTPDSLIAMYYTNTRTGKTVEYKMNGGATEKRAIEQCNLIGDVNNRRYHATTPQLYNILGHISYVAPLQNASHAYAGICIVSVENIQVITWGPNAHEAELAYKQVIIANSSQLALDGTRKLAVIEGKVVRAGSMLVAGSTTFFFYLEGEKHLFTVPVAASAKVPVTQVGDTVWIEYIASNEEVMAVNKFDNRSVVLEMTPIQADVRKRAAEHIDAARAEREQTRDAKAILEKLSPADREILQRTFKQ